MSAKVYAVHTGAEIAIGHYGTASRLEIPAEKEGEATVIVEHAAVVPDEVAAELEGRADLRIEREKPAATKAVKESKAAAAAADDKK